MAGEILLNCEIVVLGRKKSQGSSFGVGRLVLWSFTLPQIKTAES